MPRILSIEERIAELPMVYNGDLNSPLTHLISNEVAKILALEKSSFARRVIQVDVYRIDDSTPFVVIQFNTYRGTMKQFGYNIGHSAENLTLSRALDRDDYNVDS